MTAIFGIGIVPKDTVLEGVICTIVQFIIFYAWLSLVHKITQTVVTVEDEAPSTSTIPKRIVWLTCGNCKSSFGVNNPVGQAFSDFMPRRCLYCDKVFDGYKIEGEEIRTVLKEPNESQEETD